MRAAKRVHVRSHRRRFFCRWALPAQLQGQVRESARAQLQVRVTLAGKELDKAGLLLDFKELREMMKDVIDRLDHQMINDLEPFTALNPSAENLAKYFYDQANLKLDQVSQGRVRVKNVTVDETDTTTATYSD